MRFMCFHTATIPGPLIDPEVIANLVLIFSERFEFEDNIYTFINMDLKAFGSNT
jgi:hypothetical protein